MEQIAKYLSGVWEELNKVSWPTRKETTRLTLYVVGGSLLVGLFVGGTDAVLTKMLSIVILR